VNDAATARRAVVKKSFDAIKDPIRHLLYHRHTASFREAMLILMFLETLKKYIDGMRKLPPAAPA
jgi:hypothetical protein